MNSPNEHMKCALWFEVYLSFHPQIIIPYKGVGGGSKTACSQDSLQLVGMGEGCGYQGCLKEIKGLWNLHWWDISISIIVFKTFHKGQWDQKKKSVQRRGELFPLFGSWCGSGQENIITAIDRDIAPSCGHEPLNPGSFPSISIHICCRGSCSDHNVSIF